MVKQKASPENNESKSSDSIKDLILFNDDINTFDFVISSLIEVCNHEREQAEQCALIVHFKGKCTIKTDTFSKLEPMERELLSRKLQVQIK